MRKILIVTYYWPPCGGSAVLRWLSFARYLKEFGWEPIIYTPLNPEPQEVDESLLKDVPEGLRVIRTRIREPYALYKWFTGRKKSEKLGVGLMSEGRKPGLASRLSLWIRSNLFIPDPRMLWIRPSVKHLGKILKKEMADVVITTGPPHSMHLIGLGLKAMLGIKWIADFRDPWTNIDFYRDLKLSAWADNKHKRLERKVLHQADHVITVSPTMTAEFRSMGAEYVSTLTNGYVRLPAQKTSLPEQGFSLLHMGSMPASRNPLNLWEALSQLVKENPAFASGLKVTLSGRTDFTVIEAVRQAGLERYVICQPYIPHAKAVESMRRASVLLLFINNSPNARGILTNKFFEYLSAGRPVVAIGPKDGDVAGILRETGAGEIFDFDETESLKTHLLGLFKLILNHEPVKTGKGIEKYDRRNLAKELVQLINSIIP